MEKITKICTVCKEEKELEHFNNQKLGKHGKRASCRVCQNKSNKEYKQTERAKELNNQWKKTKKGKECNKRYKDNPRTKEKEKEYRQSESYKNRRSNEVNNRRFGGNRYIALERDEYKCTICGGNYMLQVHHIDECGRNKPKDVVNNSLDNLITVCARCHIQQHNPVLKRWGK